MNKINQKMLTTLAMVLVLMLLGVAAGQGQSLSPPSHESATEAIANYCEIFNDYEWMMTICRELQDEDLLSELKLILRIIGVVDPHGKIRTDRLKSVSDCAKKSLQHFDSFTYGALIACASGSAEGK